MTAPVPAPDGRPRTAVIAFWLLLGAAVALIACGMLLAVNRAPIPGFFRGAGALFAVAGVALALLGGRARRSTDPRYGRASVALAVTLVLLLAMFALISKGLVWLAIIVLLVVGAVLTLRAGDTTDV